ncbi:MAG: hypothetical protein V1926_01600 [Candidatus Peregrinibacteria bacterium]
MTLQLMSRVVVGAPAGLVELLMRSLGHPRWMYRVFAAMPKELPEQEKRRAAYFRWEKAGRPWRSAQQDRDREYAAAVEELRETQQLGGCAVTYLDGSDLKILLIVIPATIGCSDSRDIARSLVEGIVAFARGNGCRKVVCLCAFQREVEDILRDQCFSWGEEVWMKNIR